jgi:hypothetical protein
MSGEPTAGRRRLSSTAWAILTAVVALAGSVVSLAFTLWPSLKPDPLDQIGAALSVFAVEPSVTIDDWARHAFPASWQDRLEEIFGTRHPSKSQLANRGAVIYVRTQVDGYKHRSVQLTWSVHKATTGTRLPYERLIRTAPRIPPLELDAPDRSSIQLLFIPSLRDQPSGGKVFVRVELTDGSGTLAVADTPPLVKGVPVRAPVLAPSEP